MVSRRAFTRRIACFGAAIPAWTEAALAQRALVGNDWPADTAWLNANENPEGVPRSALEAIRRAAPDAWRYHYPDFRAIYGALAAAEKLDPDHIAVGAGSTDVLNSAVIAFTAADRPIIMSEPTFEVPAETAGATGRSVIRVPLTAAWSADVKRMAAEAESRGGGLIYICNPNNPTASLTPKRDIDWIAANLPRNTVLLVDEAYIHFIDNHDAESALSHVRSGKDVIVARTFSKIYGMAGLRVGFVCARPELIRRMRALRNNVISYVSGRAVEAALAEAPSLIPQRRARLVKIRTDLCDWLKGRGLKVIEPHANFVMFETGRDARELGFALLRKGVAAGRPFPPLNKMLRVSIGSEQDMAKFKQVFAEVHAG